jgi:hypothetical protein
MAKKSRKQKTVAEKKHPYPWWAKLIVCLVVAGWAAGLVFFSTGMYGCLSVMRRSSDPAYIAAILKKVTGLAKLPEGFKAQMAASMFNSSFLSLSYEPDRSGFMIWLFPAENKQGTARELTDNMASKGIPMISDELKVEKRGSMPVAGQSLEYASGVASGSQGHSVGGFIGTAVLKEDKRTLLIYGWTPPKTSNDKTANKAAAVDEQVSFNMEAATALLSAIKSF